MTKKPYNPLDKINLGISITQELVKHPALPLPPENPFPGAGIYAIYYSGDFEAYSPISKLNQTQPATIPIYVGKAIPSGGRKGGISETVPTGRSLYKRLSEHSKSIAEARNLDIKDFKFKYLVVDDIWIPLGENLLIEKYQPLWNTFLDGFGIHDPGSGRYKQARSSWDTIHPGRKLAEKCAPNSKSAKEIVAEITTYLKSHPPKTEPPVK